MKFKTILQNLPNIACRLTCCHVPFKGFFPLENIFRFVSWFAWQHAANANRSALARKSFLWLVVSEISVQALARSWAAGKKLHFGFNLFPSVSLVNAFRK